MLGLYENFPLTIHLSETFTFTLARRKLQRKIVQALQEVNRQTFSFEEVGTPTVPNCTVIFEFGIADAEGFSFLTEEEAQRLQERLDVEPMKIMDWFCGIRYYKNAKKKKAPLRFDYYMLRLDFPEKDTMTSSVFHERGPRYITPEDIIALIECRVNLSSKRKILKRNKQT
ncbi:MAG: hypothetical protein NWF05_09680 [Candidatus Bathyarchaeota archaeon]|nr:hypothetical protein [Candidatus Bathyarchaeota archaeon]